MAFYVPMNDSELDDLGAKLRTWRVEPHVPAGFQREVWQRIAARQAAREDAFLPALRAWLAHQFARPACALGLLVVSLTVGVTYAHGRAQDENARTWRTLEARYVASIDPVAMTQGRP